MRFVISFPRRSRRSLVRLCWWPSRLDRDVLGHLPAQHGVQLSGFLQTPDRADPEIAPAGYVLGGETGGAIGVTKLLCAFAGGPLRHKRRQCGSNLVAVDAIAALVWSAAWSILNSAAGDDFRNDVRQFADAVVFLGLADVEDRVVNHIPGSIKNAQHRADDIANVHDGAPGGAVA